MIETFVYLAGHPFQLLDAEDGNFLKLERMTVILYALLQHTRRAVYQAEFWTVSIQTHLVVPSRQDFAWTKVSESWVPVWMTIPEVSRSGSKLVKCSCKGDCTNCESELLATLQVQIYCIELCKMLINRKEITMQRTLFNTL